LIPTAVKTLVVIAGPTAVGKTTLAIEVARYFDTHVLSCDSRQFYREMNIGVARPTERELEVVPHHFIACRSIHDPYTAGKFASDADELAKELFKHTSLLVCAGGSGLYLRAWLQGMDRIPSDPAVRAALIAECNIHGLQHLVEELKESDPVYAAEADIKNPHRVIRALEAIRISGKRYSEWRTGGTYRPDFNVVTIGLNGPRQWLHDRIGKRVDQMMLHGLLKEAEMLYSDRNLPVLRTVGYTELFDAMDGIVGIKQAVENIKLHTRQYAKRQVTWWNKEKGIRWFDGAKKNVLQDVLQHIQMSIPT
jgi:tRNA dimethylallyltransferase